MGNCIINRIQDISGKQDVLTAGAGIDITNNVISNSYVSTSTVTRDLNTVKYPYFGYVNSASQNKPDPHGGYLIVGVNGVPNSEIIDVFQYFTPLDYSDTFGYKNIYIREYAMRNGQRVWTPWSKLASIDDVKDQIVVTYTSGIFNFNSTTDTKWEFTSSKQGYTPICFTLYNAFSSSTIISAEWFTRTSGSANIGGYGRNIYKEELTPTSLFMYIVWKKD